MGVSADQLIGTEFGRYRVVELLGEGGMARVYRGVIEGPLGFSRPVAIKLIRVDRNDREERMLRSLVNEARLGGRLSHPNVVDVLEFGESEHGFYVVMEYVDGPTLADVLGRARAAGRAVPAKISMQILADVARGLAHAHDLRDDEGQHIGLIHRDLKPGNILISRAGQAMVADFGLAKSAANLFQSTTVEAKGTPAYMSPEQVMCKELNPASDLFSLGVILYELLRGQRLFEGEHMLQIAQKITQGSIDIERAWVRTNVPYVADLFDALTTRDPAGRPPGARDVERQFGELLRGFSTELSLADYVALIDDDDTTVPTSAELYRPPTTMPSSAAESWQQTRASSGDGGPGATATEPMPSSLVTAPRRSRLWWLALPAILLGTLLLGWSMGWMQRQDEVDKARRRAERAEAHEQAVQERDQRKEERRAARRGEDLDQSGDPAADGAAEGAGEDTAGTVVGEETPNPAPESATPDASRTDPPPQTHATGVSPTTTSAEIGADAIEAGLRVDCIPWCDRITVDGTSWGGSPVLDRRVAVGQHTVMLHAAAGPETSIDIDVPEGGTKLCWNFDEGARCGGG